MQSTNLINSLQAMYRSARPLIVAETLTSPVTKLEPGQRVQATIQEQVSPGLFKVEIAGQVMQMQLPGQLKIGNLVQLQVMSNNPRLTFNFVAVSAETLSNPATRLEPGQRIQAIIQEQVSPGLFKVEIAGQVMQMQLPGQLKSGNQVQLQVMSNNPRLTFSFIASSTPITSGEQTSSSASSNPIATHEQISSTSRFLSNLTELPQTRAGLAGRRNCHRQQTDGCSPEGCPG
jgi:hypothetical protein